MPATVTSIARDDPRPVPVAAVQGVRSGTMLAHSRRHLRVLAASPPELALATRTLRFSPDFLTEFVLYALSAADLTMLLALVFVLARNIVKLIVERRRALPFARFRSKLVAVLMAMTLVPDDRGADRRQRADSQHEHRPLVQRAD